MCIVLFDREQAIIKIKSKFQQLDENQLIAIQIEKGPVLIKAGPGSGKTLVIVLRALFLILTGAAKPSEIIMTTFTEKASLEIRQRLVEYAKILECEYPVHEINVGTIHSICDKIIQKYINFTPLKRNYQVLDGLV
jgi:DNA helicase-2/ATP-dependent DNA helicase PcrA